MASQIRSSSSTCTVLRYNGIIQSVDMQSHKARLGGLSSAPRRSFVGKPLFKGRVLFMLFLSLSDSLEDQISEVVQTQTHD